MEMSFGSWLGLELLVSILGLVCLCLRSRYWIGGLCAVLCVLVYIGLVIANFVCGPYEALMISSGVLSGIGVCMVSLFLLLKSTTWLRQKKQERYESCLPIWCDQKERVKKWKTGTPASFLCVSITLSVVGSFLVTLAFYFEVWGVTFDGSQNWIVALFAGIAVNSSLVCTCYQWWRDEKQTLRNTNEQNTNAENNYDSSDNEENEREGNVENETNAGIPILKWRRTNQNGGDEIPVSIAFSGGGARAASIALGALGSFTGCYPIGLEHLWLPNEVRQPRRSVRIEAISTVSGGGYVGSGYTVYKSNNRDENADVKYLNHLQSRAASGFLVNWEEGCCGIFGLLWFIVFCVFMPIVMFALSYGPMVVVGADAVVFFTELMPPKVFWTASKMQEGSPCSCLKGAMKLDETAYLFLPFSTLFFLPLVVSGLIVIFELIYNCLIYRVKLIECNKPQDLVCSVFHDVKMTFLVAISSGVGLGLARRFTFFDPLVCDLAVEMNIVLSWLLAALNLFVSLLSHEKQGMMLFLVQMISIVSVAIMFNRNPPINVLEELGAYSELGSTWTGLISSLENEFASGKKCSADYVDFTGDLLNECWSKLYMISGVLLAVYPLIQGIKFRVVQDFYRHRISVTYYPKFRKSMEKEWLLNLIQSPFRWRKCCPTDKVQFNDLNTSHKYFCNISIHGFVQDKHMIHADNTVDKFPYVLKHGEPQDNSVAATILEPVLGYSKGYDVIESLQIRGTKVSTGCAISGGALAPNLGTAVEHGGAPSALIVGCGACCARNLAVKKKAPARNLVLSLVYSVLGVLVVWRGLSLMCTGKRESDEHVCSLITFKRLSLILLGANVVVIALVRICKSWVHRQRSLARFPVVSAMLHQVHGVTMYSKNRAPATLFASDGGHTDNLALLPLLDAAIKTKNRSSRIMLVDSSEESDPDRVGRAFMDTLKLIHDMYTIGDKKIELKATFKDIRRMFSDGATFFHPSGELLVEFAQSNLDAELYDEGAWDGQQRRNRVLRLEWKFTERQSVEAEGVIFYIRPNQSAKNRSDKKRLYSFSYSDGLPIVASFFILVTAYGLYYGFLQVFNHIFTLIIVTSPSTDSDPEVIATISLGVVVALFLAITGFNFGTRGKKRIHSVVLLVLVIIPTFVKAFAEEEVKGWFFLCWPLVSPLGLFICSFMDITIFGDFPNNSTILMQPFFHRAAFNAYQIEGYLGGVEALERLGAWNQPQRQGKEEHRTNERPASNSSPVDLSSEGSIPPNQESPSRMVSNPNSNRTPSMGSSDINGTNTQQANDANTAQHPPFSGLNTLGKESNPQKSFSDTNSTSQNSKVKPSWQNQMIPPVSSPDSFPQNRSSKNSEAKVNAMEPKPAGRPVPSPTSFMQLRVPIEQEMTDMSGSKSATVTVERSNLQSSGSNWVQSPERAKTSFIGTASRPPSENASRKNCTGDDKVTVVSFQSVNDSTFYL